MGLRGRQHPAMSFVTTSSEVSKMRPHLKMLTGSYLTFKTKSEQSGGSPLCRLCRSGEELLIHLVASRPVMSDTRNKAISDMIGLAWNSQSQVDLTQYLSDEYFTTQFVLDVTSMNLPKRVSASDPVLSLFFKLSRDLCFYIDKTRTKLLKDLLT